MSGRAYLFLISSLHEFNLIIARVFNTNIIATGVRTNLHLNGGVFVLDLQFG